MILFCIFAKTNDMTDLEKFIDCYKQFGIDVKTFTNVYGFIEITLSNENLGMGVTCDKRFCGYSAFFSTIEFTQNGEFVRQGFWE